MYLALDIGPDFTHIAGWDEGQSLEEASIKVRIPGIGYCSPVLSVADQDSLAKHIAFIYREFLLPTRCVISSASIALPGIPDLNSRRMLLGIVEQVMGLAEVEIISRPLGLVVGWSQALPQPLCGDIMLVEVQGPTFYFALLSIFADGRIILENVNRGSWEDLAVAGHESGYLDESGWGLEHLLLTGKDCDSSDLAGLIASMDESTQVWKDPDPGWKTVKGLYAGKSGQAGSSRFMIYPYDFYLNMETPENKIGLKLGFDTRNLELAIDGSYLLAKFDTFQYLTDDQTRRVQLRILEVPRCQTTDKASLAGQSVVLDVDSHLQDLPAVLNLRLNLKTAFLSLELPGETALMTAVMPSPLDSARANLDQLYLHLAANGKDSDLHQAYQAFIASRSSDPDLGEAVQFCLFHLYGLLQVYCQ